jgi:hypothetical protein
VKRYYNLLFDLLVDGEPLVRGISEFFTQNRMFSSKLCLREKPAKQKNRLDGGFSSGSAD